MKKSFIFILSAMLAVSLGSAGFSETKKTPAKPAATATKTPAKPAAAAAKTPAKPAPAKKIVNPLIGAWYDGKDHRIVFSDKYLTEQVMMMTDNPGWGTRDGWFSGNYTLTNGGLDFDIVDHNVESETPVVLCKLKVLYTIKGSTLTLKYDLASAKAADKIIEAAFFKAMKARNGDDYEPDEYVVKEMKRKSIAAAAAKSYKYVLDSTPWIGKWYSGYSNVYQVTSNGLKISKNGGNDSVVTLTGKWGATSPVSLTFKNKAGKLQKITVAYTIENDRLKLTFQNTDSAAYTDIPKEFVTNAGVAEAVECQK